MQSVVKRSDGGSVFKLSDVMKNNLDAGAPSSGETDKQRPQDLPGNKDRGGLGETKTPGKSFESEDLTAHPAAGEDGALAWLKSIGNSSPGFTGDAPKGDVPARPEPPLANPFRATHPTPSPVRWPPHHAGDSGAFDEESAFVEPSGAPKLARRLSFKFEPRHAPPQSLSTALMPFIAATAIFAFLAGSAVVYFLTGSPAPVRTTGAATTEPQAVLSTARPDQPDSKKSGFQRASPAAPQPAPAPAKGPSQSDMGLFNLSGEQSASKPTAPQQLETWSDTVETFKQFVKKPGVKGADDQ